MRAWPGLFRPQHPTRYNRSPLPQSQRAAAAAASEWGAQRAEKAAAKAAHNAAEVRHCQEFETYMQRYEERHQQVREQEANGTASPSASRRRRRNPGCPSISPAGVCLPRPSPSPQPPTPTALPSRQDMRSKAAKQAQLTGLLDEQLDWREEVAAEEAADARQVGAAWARPAG